MRRTAVALLALGALASAAAQTVAYNGRLGDKAVLVIDGQPRSVATGGVVAGVRLVSVDADTALVEVGGQRLVLPLGGTPSNLGARGAAGGGAGRIVLSADGAGHFITRGAINGRTAQFIVDTGATAVAMGRGEAERMGVDWKRGRLGSTSTANGTAEAHMVTLAELRVGDVVVYDVTAVVVPAPMPYVLLGNTFLNRFQMRRDNDVLTLERRY